VLDFDAFDAEQDRSSVVCVPEREPPDLEPNEHSGPVELAAHAAALEEEGDLAQAAEMYRAALASGGLTAELCFQLAETLYRLGDLPAARERYYMALEIDEEFVEARANVGCLLAEMGETELAIAALEGALTLHPDYADAHYHLARLLDQQGRNGEAETHWVRFLECAPDSPWADEALDRLEAAET
jgi:tetratricopeptide (TPR) repeat protein